MKKQREKEVVITANDKWFDFNLQEIFDYKDLVISFVSRNFKLIYKQTILGPLWLILNPIATSIIFTFIFGQFAGLSTDGIPQFLFYMSGNTAWNFFNTNSSSNSNTFVDNAYMYKKLYFPRLTVPIAQTISSLLNFAIQFAALLVIFIFYAIKGDVSFSFRMLLAPIFILHAAVLSMSIGLISSSLTAKYRDFAYIFNLVLQLWMYVTPVVYPISYTGGWMQKILLLNPMTPIVNNFRWAFIGCGSFLSGSWAISIVLTAIVAVVALAAFCKVEKTFVDTV